MTSNVGFGGPRQPPRPARSQHTHNDYSIGVICALAVEKAAIVAMLDDVHEALPIFEKDENSYTFGRIGDHNIVAACLPAGMTGNNSAATVAKDMLRSFPIKIGLMVGVGGGVWSKNVDVRLGDVVVSQPEGIHGGVVQWDFGKMENGGFIRTGSLNKPPRPLLNAVQDVRIRHIIDGDGLTEHLSKLVQNKPQMAQEFTYQGTVHDCLYESTYSHVEGETCDGCDIRQTVKRQPRITLNPCIHYGNIASGNQVIKNSHFRDRIAQEQGVICFEMEAAGLMDSFPCLVIRGICDYADTHKNKRWQSYAAATAAAYAKEVLLVMPSADIVKSHAAEQTTKGVSGQCSCHVYQRCINTNRAFECVAKSTYCIPFLKNRHFIGRRDELAILQERLLVKQDCRKMSIVGLGGIGKTQVALQFAYSVKETRPEYSIFWVPALSMESIEQACASVAKALHLPYDANKEDDVKEVVQQYLSSSRARWWLLVVDNADDAEIFFGTGQSKGIADYLPESEMGMVVYTTRTPEVAEQTRGDVVELGAMDRRDAATFLARSLTRKDFLRNDAAATELLDELTCLPLAIAQAAAYLNRNRMSVAKYVQLLQSTEQDMVALMSREFRDDTRYKDSANAVATTWVVSFSQIRERNAAAASLLAFMSCVEWKAIPRSLLPRVQGELQMEEAIGTLCGYSFLTRQSDSEIKEKEEWYDIHRLVHLATRIWVERHGDAARVQEEAVRQVVSVFPSEDYANHAVWRTYLPHALRLLEGRQGCNIEERSKLCLLVGLCLRVDSRIREAVRWLEESYLWRVALGKNDSDLRSSQSALAIAYLEDGQVQKAIELQEHVSAVHEKMLAEEDPDQLASQYKLGIVYQADGQVQKAVELLEHVVAVHEETLAKKHPDRLASQHVLAGAYLADGQVQKAVALLEHVVKVEQEVLAEKDPDRLASQYELARAYQAYGQVQKAVKLLEHVVAVKSQFLCDDHPSRLMSLDALKEFRAQLDDNPPEDL
jgi:nucleoside phosphorylase